MAETTTDHETIRKWVKSRSGRPAAVERAHKGGDIGIIRIMSPDSPQSEPESLVEISWDEFFREFEQRRLALLYDPKSLFSKVVGRDPVEGREGGDRGGPLTGPDPARTRPARARRSPRRAPSMVASQASR